MTQFKIGDKNIDFIFQGRDILYPNPIKEGLILWYDYKGMKNSDVNKNSSQDLTNTIENVGIHDGFIYNSVSGYGKKGIKFDGIDDKITPYVKNADGTAGVLDFKKINNGQKYSVDMTLKLSEVHFEQGSEIFLTGGTNGRFWINLIKTNDEYCLSNSTYFGSEGGRVNTFSLSSRNINLGDEINITVTYNKEGYMILYINGEEVEKTQLSDIEITSAQDNELITVIGATQSDSYYRRFNHELYSLKIYNRVLTEQEVKHNYKLEKSRFGL
ncbi:hypothetical protein IR128_11315 [Staphylococcus lentus]|uniref:LamG-like jellyroll fold domain-containing protein n=1 Tax=Mammaliicoccus lentus TaxID=42858 RepID=UPI0018844B5A|nr:LamG-like jellyroll fold domain-containing protein [Mammaliicoccus lentus]MBF0842298.1 hypothetical protein [Mammaliicoccus lentus]